MTNRSRRPFETRLLGLVSLKIGDIHQCELDIPTGVKYTRMWSMTTSKTSR
jgi:hypothetical protein